MARHRTAFILTGGAGKGAYSAGVLKALAGAGVIPDVVVGCSSGALNGAFCAAYTAADRFQPELVEAELVPLWMREGSIWNLLRSRGANPMGLYSFYQIGNLDQMLEQQLTLLLAQLEELGVQRQVRLLVSLSDLRGCPCRVAALPRPITVLQFAHYAGFTFQPGRPLPELEPLKKALMASSALPFLFAPVEMDTSCIVMPRPGEQPADTSLFADGGLIDNAPIEPLIHATGVSEIYVVSPYPFVRHEGPIEGFWGMMTRFMEVLLSRNLLHDLHLINELNARKARVEDYCRRHRRRPTEEICRLAGFESLKQYLRYAQIRLHLLAPGQPLPGHALSGFWDASLRQEYITRGYEDGLQYLVDHLSVAEEAPQVA